MRKGIILGILALLALLLWHTEVHARADPQEGTVRVLYRAETCHIIDKVPPSPQPPFGEGGAQGTRPVKTGDQSPWRSFAAAEILSLGALLLILLLRRRREEERERGALE